LKLIAPDESSSNEVLGVTAIALAEFAWTSCGPTHQRHRSNGAAFLVDLLARENLITLGLQKAEAQAALQACTLPTGAPQFGEALIAATARSAGITEIYAFDSKFELTGMQPLAPP
jgi:predicted nucleic acid-binding protein